MFQKFKNLLLESVAANENIQNEESPLPGKVQIAAAALMVEMANADGNFSTEEKVYISSSLKEVFNLDDEEIDELINITEEELKESISLYEFSEVINKNFTKEEKLNLVDHLWKLIYVDDQLDKYEDKLIKQIGGMFLLDHKDIIDSKLFVKQEMKK